MADVHIPALDAFLYLMIVALLFYLLGYGNAFIDLTMGFKNPYPLSEEKHDDDKPGPNNGVS